MSLLARRSHQGPSNSRLRHNDFRDLNSLLNEQITLVPPDSWDIFASSEGFRLNFSSQLALSDNAFFVKLRWQLRKAEIWIDRIQVPVLNRQRGFGTKLVNQIQQFGYELGIEYICLHPLQSVREFWENRGFSDHPHRSRVLMKYLQKDSGRGVVLKMLNDGGNSFSKS